MKVDFKKQIPTYTAPRRRFEIVTVAPSRFLMLDGHGDPNTSQAWADALATIYPMAYTLKFLSKNALDRDYTVMPLEALWWSDDMDAFTAARDKSKWDWTAMIMVADWLTGEHVEAARQAVDKKGGAPSLSPLRLATLSEGLAVQTLHIGAYDDEGPVLDTMHNDFIPAHSLRMNGKHHEIYLSDSRRTAPEKLKTILRQPVARIVSQRVR